MRKHAIMIDPQPWAFPDRPRVLIELADPEAALQLSVAIRKAGCAVAVCQGPDASTDPTTRCPLHMLEPCVAVEGADLVVTALDFDQESGRDVLRGLRTRYPSIPLVVATTVRQSRDLAELLAGCIVVSADAKPERIVAAVAEALPSLPKSRRFSAQARLDA
jgi:DNA-binding NarL/FixJ family response regulator